MLRFLPVIGLLLAGSRVGYAQWPPTPEADSIGTEQRTFTYALGAGFGLSRLENADGEDHRFALASLMPEFFYGKAGVGFLINLPYRPGEGLRDESYDSAADFLAWIRYLQYGQKGDYGVYGRLGELEEALLGYGQHINLYANTVSLDDPRRGVELDYHQGAFGGESVYSDLIGAEVFGLRGTYRPFFSDEAARLHPLILGASLAGDFSDEGAMVNAEHPGLPFVLDSQEDLGAPSLGAGKDDGTLLLVGLDAGMMLYEAPTHSLLGYGTVSKILRYGSGLSVGLIGTRRFERRTRVEGRIEQRMLGKHYLSGYFDALYEAQRIREVNVRFDDGTEADAYTTKRNVLLAQDALRLGSLLSVAWRYQDKLRVRASFEHVWNEAQSGWLHLDTRLRAADLPFYLRLVYDQVDIGARSDIFRGTGDDTLFRVEFAYQYWKYAMIGIAYRQSFEAKNRNGVVVGRDKRSRVEPKVMLVIPAR